MGILNVTPDSFFDGGRFLDLDAALSRGLEMVAEGADVIDVGGESSRPGAEPVDEAEELRRVVPVVEALAARAPRVSVDTVKPAVAAAAVAAGATLVNDVSASLWPVAAELGAGWVAMHRQGSPEHMQDDPRYDDVVAEVGGFLLGRLDEALEAGVDEVWVDPGIGFGKTLEHNVELLAHLDALVTKAGEAGARGVMVGVSRKTSMGRIGRPEGAAPLAPEEREEPSLATAVWAMSQGATMVRVHDVAATVQAAALVGTVAAGPAGPAGTAGTAGTVGTAGTARGGEAA
jgi:dihydropteroate synthase